MARPDKLQLLQRQIAWHAQYSLTLVEDLEDAARDGDHAAVCTLAQAFVASCLVMTHHLWPGGRRLTDRLVTGRAEELRRSLGVTDDSPLHPERTAPLGNLIQFNRPDCEESIDLENLTVQIQAEPQPLRPIFAAIRELRGAASEKASTIPRVA